MRSRLKLGTQRIIKKFPDISWKALSVFNSDRLMRSYPIEQERDFAIYGFQQKTGKCGRSITVKNFDVQFEIIDFMTQPIDDSICCHKVMIYMRSAYLVNVKVDLYPNIVSE